MSANCFEKNCWKSNVYDPLNSQIILRAKNCFLFLHSKIGVDDEIGPNVVKIFV